MIRVGTYVAIIDYKYLNQPIAGAYVLQVGDRENAIRIIKERYNKNGRQLTKIRSLRKL